MFACDLTPEDQKLHTQKLTGRAIKFIEQNKANPFFIYLPHPMPHVPLYTSDQFTGLTKRGTFGDVISEIDWSVGKILDALDQNGIRDNTLVVFTSDNGPWLRYGDHGGSAGPLREGKGTFFEGGFRVPCIMSWPGTIKSGAVNDHFAATIDLLPTFAKLAAADLPEDRPIDGVDLQFLFDGESRAENERVFLHYSGQRLSAIRQGRWKLVFPGTYRVWNQGGGGLPGQGKENRRIPLSLFDLDADVGETNNVVDKHPEVVTRLEKLADHARAELGDGPNSPGASTRPLGGR